MAFYIPRDKWIKSSTNSSNLTVTASDQLLLNEILNLKAN